MLPRCRADSAARHQDHAAVRPVGVRQGGGQGRGREALIAAALTAAMVLLFLGNWRSTLIIALTIPLSILSSILALQMLGETLNLMTLGGLALSVGILVDQAIVTIENIERHLHMGKPS
jgi:multidrug efflux pump subunit AcrB